jgi:hypothetical protein
LVSLGSAPLVMALETTDLIWLSVSELPNGAPTVVLPAKVTELLMWTFEPL